MWRHLLSVLRATRAVLQRWPGLAPREMVPVAARSGDVVLLPTERLKQLRFQGVRRAAPADVVAPPTTQDADREGALPQARDDSGGSDTRADAREPDIDLVDVLGPADMDVAVEATIAGDAAGASDAEDVASRGSEDDAGDRDDDEKEKDDEAKVFNVVKQQRAPHT